MEKLILFNTLTREKEEFKPIEAGTVRLYCCGPTVYNYAHIGNLRAYFFEDILKRVMLYNGFDVHHVVNVTDVGHLVSDDDEGEDKMEKGSAREGKTVWEIADFYLQAFLEDIKLLNILPPSLWCKATDNIKEQIEMVKCLEAKGFTYITSDGVYFDTAKFPEYGKMALLDIEGLEEGKRISFSEEKKNKTDFALWKFSPKGQQRQMEWESPWGKGFPGWHIECSAMSRKFLGDTFDIHCGGVDHIPIHHTNEIAQSEACTGKKFVNYWLHGEFLIEEKGKMSKSAGEFLRLKTLIDKGYSPLDYRYFLLMTHYRKKIKFSFENLDAARNGYKNLCSKISAFLSDQSVIASNLSAKATDSPVIARNEVNADVSERIKTNAPVILSEAKNLIYKNKFLSSINDDLNVSEALATLWDALKDNELKPEEKLAIAYEIDKVLGLKLDEIKPLEKSTGIPHDIIELAEKRKQAKLNKDFKSADDIRNEIKSKGFDILDKKEGAYEIIT